MFSQILQSTRAGLSQAGSVVSNPYFLAGAGTVAVVATGGFIWYRRSQVGKTEEAHKALQDELQKRTNKTKAIIQSVKDEIESNNLALSILGKKLMDVRARLSDLNKRQASTDAKMVDIVGQLQQLNRSHSKDKGTARALDKQNKELEEEFIKLSDSIAALRHEELRYENMISDYEERRKSLEKILADNA